MSANSAVTVLRSPSSVSALTASAKRIAEAPGCLAAADLPMGEPQFPQNFAVGAFSNPHEAHGALNVAPHSLQNFRPSGFSVLHCAQIIWLRVLLGRSTHRAAPWRLSNRWYRSLR